MQILNNRIMTTTKMEELKRLSATWVEALAAVHDELESEATALGYTSSILNCDDNADE